VNARSTLKFAALAAAALPAQACAPSPPPAPPSAVEVCADKAGRRVVDELCRGAAADNPYNWYYLDAGVPIPPLASPLSGGSLIATNGVAYATPADGSKGVDGAQPMAQQDAATAPQADTVVVRDATGAFVVNGAVNGRPVTFVVDTGASDVVLSPNDAEKVGLDQASLNYDRLYQTANGVGRAASFQADEISIGAIKIANVSASVNQAPMKYSLLGRAFLDRLNGFRVEHGRLYLR